MNVQCVPFQHIKKVNIDESKNTHSTQLVKYYDHYMHAMQQLACHLLIPTRRLADTQCASKSLIKRKTEKKC